MRTGTSYRHNGLQLCSTSDHDLVYPIIQHAEGQVQKPKKTVMDRMETSQRGQDKGDGKSRNSGRQGRGPEADKGGINGDQLLHKGTGTECRKGTLDEVLSRQKAEGRSERPNETTFSGNKRDKHGLKNCTCMPAFLRTEQYGQQNYRGTAKKFTTMRRQCCTRRKGSRSARKKKVDTSQRRRESLTSQ